MKEDVEINTFEEPEISNQEKEVLTKSAAKPTKSAAKPTKSAVKFASQPNIFKRQGRNPEVDSKTTGENKKNNSNQLEEV